MDWIFSESSVDFQTAPATSREMVPGTFSFSQPLAKDLTAIEAPANAPMVFIRTSVIEGKRTGENTW